ncbi:MAG: hypothetical protein FWC64_04500 [Treponema sp.]|nr:hypothetical protein [Treponema sp.]
MKKLLFLLAGIAFVFAGCRNVTTDLHDIHTITFYPMGGAIQGLAEGEVLRQETDVFGRIASFPSVQPRFGYRYDDNNVEYQFEYQFRGWVRAVGGRVTPQSVFVGNETLLASWFDGREVVLIPQGVNVLLGGVIGLHNMNLPISDALRTINLTQPEDVTPWVLEGLGDITIQTTVGLTRVILSLAGSGAMFTVRAGTTLTLQNVDIQGPDTNIASLITVEHGGTLILGNGVVLRDNHANTPDYGGAVTIFPGGEMEMNHGALISNNRMTHPFASFQGGGGVRILGGTFRMLGGEIRGNAAGTGGGVQVDLGGRFYMGMPGSPSVTSPIISGNMGTVGIAVWVGHPPGAFPERDSVFTMYSGSIENNNSGTGPVFAQLGGIFRMHGGRIFNNTAGEGGGVNVGRGTFIMYGGEIANNRAFLLGGGVSNSGTFVMRGGTIRNNDAGGAGGGVANRIVVDEGRFFMLGGEISGNTTAAAGGGVFVGPGAEFMMLDGSITNNVSTNNSGGGIFMIEEEHWAGIVLVNGNISGNTGHLDTPEVHGGNINIDPSSFAFFGRIGEWVWDPDSPILPVGIPGIPDINISPPPGWIRDEGGARTVRVYNIEWITSEMELETDFLLTEHQGSVFFYRPPDNIGSYTMDAEGRIGHVRFTYTDPIIALIDVYGDGVGPIVPTIWPRGVNIGRRLNGTPLNVVNGVPSTDPE